MTSGFFKPRSLPNLSETFCMPSKDPRIDAYIKKSADFAVPILEHLRQLVHTVCADAEETMKWSFPHFMYKGDMLCSMASFKQHCAFGFWKAPIMKDAEILLGNREHGMGSIGKIASLKELPSDKQLTAWIKEAMKLNDAGIKVEKQKTTAKPPASIPAFLKKALSANKPAEKHFKAFSPSQQREYIDWLIEAKTAATQEKRLSQALEWIAEGKIRNWKYVR